MITCTLGEKVYTIDFVTGRALREMGEANEALDKVNKALKAAQNGEENVQAPEMSETMDALIKWFCILFRNQFTPDEMLDNYPSDRLISDIVKAMQAVSNNATLVLDTFPTQPTAEEIENLQKLNNLMKKAMK